MAPPLIAIEHVDKIYRLGDVDLKALSDVSVTIDKGEFVAIMGASGSGKSTLMNIIGCLDRPTHGRYLLDGVDVANYSRSERARLRGRTLGFVFQNFNLLPRTSAQENVELPLLYSNVPAGERGRRARAALERVGLADRAAHTPAKLSGGQQQRVAIARALVNEAKVILADEPTGALDSKTSMEVMALLQELGRGGITVVLVTHEPDIGRCADRVLLMRDGKIVSDTRQAPMAAIAANFTPSPELRP